MADPVEQKFRGFMQRLASTVDGMLRKKFKRKIGFTILLFELNEFSGGRVNYISNADRADMIAAMKEWIARQEGRYVEPDPMKKGLDN